MAETTMKGRNHRAESEWPGGGRSAVGQKRGVETRKAGGERIYRDIPEELRALIEPVVDEHGCELVDVEVARNRGTGLLRIIVDNSNGDGRVAIERCVSISREVETLLDASDAMPGAYRLEVSSPGLDRVLGREKDFERAVDHEIKLRTRRPIDGRKRYRGRLVSFESGVLRMRLEGITESDAVRKGRARRGGRDAGRAEMESGVEGNAELEGNAEKGGNEVLIPIEEVEKANSIYEFTSADFAKEPSRRGSSQSGGV